MEPEPSRELTGRGVAVALATFVALSVAVALTWWSPEPEVEPAGPSGAPVVAATPVTSYASPLIATTLDAPEPRAAKTDAAAADEIEVCGGNWLKLGADGQPTPESAAAVSSRLIDEAASTAFASMKASASPRAQAAAHYFRAGRASTAKLLRSSCDGDEACIRTASAWQGDGAGQRDALARMAQDSDDPQVYAWAYRSCRAAPAADRGACQMINAAQWARLDPLNAEPWLALGAEAQSRKDAAAFEDAMFHVASAERHDPGWAALPASLMDHLPADDSALIGTRGLIVQVVGLEAKDGTAWAPVARYCGARELVDSNRGQTCERIATLLVEHSSTTLARSVGVGIGTRLGWPAERLDALALQRDAEAAVQQKRSVEANALDCATLRGEVDRWRDIVQFGEVEALRRDVIASGKPVAQLAVDYRRFVAEATAREGRQGAAASSAAFEGRASDALRASR
ncbi:MAG: hypothetical protein ABI460_15110 [Caldimonas sp.]